MADGAEVARAYATIIPSMEGSQSKIAADLAGVVGNAGSTAGAAVGAGLATSAKSALSKFVVPAAVVAGAAAVTKELYDVGESFDRMYDSISRGTGATGEMLDNLEQSARNVYSKVPASLDSVGDTLAELNTRTGATGDTLEHMTQQFLELTEMGYSTDIDKATGMMNAWGIETENMSTKLDELFIVSQSTGIGMDDLTGAMSGNANAMEQLGFSFEETAALAGQLDKAGLDASSMLGKLGKACVNMAKDGEQPAEAYNRIVGEIQDFVAAGDEAKALDLASELFGTKGAAQFLQALESGAMDTRDLTDAMLDANGAIDDNASKTRSAGEAFEELKHNAELVLEPLGSAVFTTASDVLKDIAEGAGEAYDFFTTLGGELESNEELMNALSGAGEALGGVFDSLGSFGETVWGVLTDIGNALGITSGEGDSLSGTISGVLIPALDAAKGILGGFKGAIDAGSDAIKFFKSLFNGTLEFPYIKTPHFNISGGDIPWGIGGMGTPPTVSVDWYARGGIVDGAQLVGVGEAGPEAIVPLSGPQMKPFVDAVRAGMRGSGGVTIVLNGATLNDDQAMRDAAFNLLVELQRKARM